MARITFSAILLILLYRALAGSLMYSTRGAAFPFAETEMFYKWFKASGLPQFLTSGYGPSGLFDIALFVFPALYLISLNRLYAIISSLLLLLYFFTFNIVTGHHYHSLVGIILITLPFWFKRVGRFNLAWEGVRYYFLYIFSSAALWKILRGSAFYTEQLSNVLKAQQLDMLLSKPGSLQAQSVQYLIAHPQVSHIVLLVNVALQLSFAVGFFTKRFDTVLFCLAIVFCLANYFVMNIVSAELLVLNLTLLSFKTFTTEALGKTKNE